MAGLKFLIKGDDSPIRKTLEKLKKDVANANQAAIQSSVRVASAGKKQQKEVVDLINKQTEAIKKRNAEDAKRPKFSNSAAEVAAYQKGKVGAPNMTGALVAPKSQQDLINQFKQLDVEQMKLTANYQAGRVSAEVYTQTIDTLSKKQSELRTAIQNYNKGQEAAATGTTKVNGATKVQIGLLERLNSQLKTYKEKKTGLVDVDQIAIANKKIQETEKEIVRLNNVGRIGFDDLGNKIQGTTGKIDRLKRVAAGYRLMADSSKDVKQIEIFNAKAQQASTAALQLSNVGKKGFDEMGNKIKRSGNVAGQLWGGLKGIANLLPGIGIAGLLAFAIEPLINYLSKLDLLGNKMKEIASQKFESPEYTQALKDTEKLTVNIQAAKAGYIEKDRVVKDYNDTIGKTTGVLNSFNEVEEFQKKNVGAYLKMIEMKAEAQAFLAVSTEKATEAAKRQLIGANILDYGKAIMNQLGRGQFNWGNIKNEAQISAMMDAGDSKKESDEALKIFRQKMLEAEKFAKDHKFNFFGDNGTGEDGFKSAQSRYQSMINDIAKLTDEYNRNSKTEEDKARQAIVDRFAEMRRQLIAYNTWAASYNKKAPAGKRVGMIGLGILNPIKKKALDDLSAQQEVERAKIAIEQQKQLYSQYEDYKLEYGKAKANERFAAELKGYSSYVDFIQSQLKSLEGKNDAGSNALKDFYTKELPKAQKESNDRQFDFHMKNLARIQEATKTAANEEQRINEQYDKDLATLRKEYAGEELAEREKALAENRKKELDGVRQLAWEQTQIAQRMAEDLFFKTREEIKAHIKQLKQDLKDPSLTPAQREAGKQALDQAQNLYNSSSSTSKAASEIAKYGHAAAGSFQEMGAALEGINDDLAYTLSSIGEMAGLLTNLAAGIASGDPLKIITASISAVAGLFSMGKKVKEMNAAARAEQKKFYDEAIKGEREYQALLRQRELDTVRRGKTSYQAIVAQLEALKKQSPEIEKAYNSIFKSLQGQEFVSDQGYKHGTWFRKAKTWDIMASLAGTDYARLEQLYSQGKLKDQALADFEALKKLREELLAAGMDVEDLQQQLAEMLTGTSVEGLSDALADLFENGKLAAKDFGDTFENILGKAILNTFKYSVIEKAMGPLFDQLATMTEGGKIPGADEIKKFLEDATVIGEQLGGQWKAITDGLKNAGMDIFKQANQTGSGLPGAIRREMTEQTASELTGLYRATYDLQKKQHNTLLEQQSLMQQKLSVLNQIATNTGATAAHTARLEAIENTLATIATNTKPSQSSRSLGG